MIAVVDYHKGNLKSVERGLAGVGADARITDDLELIERADAVVLPGVGAFADAAGSMRDLGQMDLVVDRIRAGVPFLGICLGLQLLFEEGEEHAQGQTNKGMGLVPGSVARLPKQDAGGRSYKIPHVGWNNVDFEQNPLFDGIDDGEYFYFTHSYAIPESPATIATTTHSITFPCAVQIGERAWGVQFHPEKSSDAGAKLLANFVRLAGER